MADLAARIDIYSSWGTEAFPYPKSTDAVRHMSLLDCGDLVVYRALVGRLMPSIVLALRDMPAYAARLVDPPPRWRLENPYSAHRRFREKSLALLQGDDGLACVTDWTRFFESIQLANLEFFLMSCPRPDAGAVAALSNLLSQWHARSPVRGLPIGPEASSVLGNAFMTPIDRCFVPDVCPHARWMDDIVFSGLEENIADQLGLVDEISAYMGVARSVAKTRILPKAQARSEIQDLALDYVAAGMRARPQVGGQRLRDLFDAKVIESPNALRRTFRFTIGGMLKHRDEYAIVPLSQDRVLANLDPRLTAEYLGTLGMRDDTVRSDMLATIDSQPSDTHDALRLHYLKAFARNGKYGRSEGTLFMSIALNAAERAPVRAWAWMAARRTSEWRPKEATEFGIAEDNRLVARAAVASLKGHQDEMALRRFRYHVDRRRPLLRFTARWAAA